jgi:hypothetical protein
VKASAPSPGHAAQAGVRPELGVTKRSRFFTNLGCQVERRVIFDTGSGMTREEIILSCPIELMETAVGAENVFEHAHRRNR